MSRQLNVLISTKNIFQAGDKYVEGIMEIAPSAGVTIIEEKNLNSGVLKEAEIVFGWPDPRMLKEAQSLRWLQLPSVGADRYVNRNLFCREDVILTCSRGVFSQPISEHVVSTILSFVRAMPLYAEQRKEKKWQRLFKERDFCGSTVGIIGLGSIGTEVAKKVRSFGVKVLAVKRDLSEKPDFVDELFGEDGLDRVIEHSDYIVIALPYTAKTKELINRDRIAKLKRNAFLVNIARGGIVDQDALIEALRENRIAGAGIDAASPEPLPADSPLWDMDNVILTPHSSGSSPTNDDRRFEIFYKNLDLYLAGKPLVNRVDFDEGY